MMKITKDSTVEIACEAPIWGTIGENAERYNVSDLEGLLRELSELAERKGAIYVKISLEGD